ncbi:hypothetical protein [Mycolicibacterium porcinum]|uniref:hypothetical protein n=1 Tax=Mycolicibacterium porcinum TaxID=39693 RepID=UPI000848D7DD|nr:hypothetical protein [Mycolicibacterium porcinum]ODR16749.1 hypothetical protein BHQ19_30515 [Mycolicibacterium porcinum]
MARNEIGFKGAVLKGAKIDGAANISTKTVTVNASSTSGTATVTAGSVVLGIYPAGNQDQFVDNVAIATTTLTVTLAAAATANNVFKVTVLEP